LLKVGFLRLPLLLGQ